MAISWCGSFWQCRATAKCHSIRRLSSSANAKARTSYFKSRLPMLPRWDCFILGGSGGIRSSRHWRVVGWCQGPTRETHTVRLVRKSYASGGFAERKRGKPLCLRPEADTEPAGEFHYLRNKK